MRTLLVYLMVVVLVLVAIQQGVRTASRPLRATQRQEMLDSLK